MKTQRVSDVKLGLDDHGFLWAQEPSLSPIRLDGDMESSIKDFVGANPKRIFVLATTPNEPLIHLLCQLRRRDGKPHHVMLGPGAAAAPGSWLGQTSVDRPPSVGGWRDMTAADEVTYALASELSRTGEVTPRMVVAASRHPAWPALSFSPGFSHDHAVRLVAAMKDPRWHVNPSNPSSGRKLTSFFGLGDQESGCKNLRDTVFEPTLAKRRRLSAEHAKTVFYAWSGGATTPPLQDVDPGRDFFWRMYAVSQDQAVGAWRVSRFFLTFVRDVWLDNLTPPREYEQVIRRLGTRQPENVKYVALKPATSYRRELFVPHLFFETTIDISAWERHVREWRKLQAAAV
jgi:hypothetical protein